MGWVRFTVGSKTESTKANGQCCQVTTGTSQWSSGLYAHVVWLCSSSCSLRSVAICLSWILIKLFLESDQNRVSTFSVSQRWSHIKRITQPGSPLHSLTLSANWRSKVINIRHRMGLTQPINRPGALHKWKASWLSFLDVYATGSADLPTASWKAYWTAQRLMLQDSKYL